MGSEMCIRDRFQPIERVQRKWESCPVTRNQPSEVQGVLCIRPMGSLSIGDRVAGEYENEEDRANRCSKIALQRVVLVSHGKSEGRVSLHSQWAEFKLASKDITGKRWYTPAVNLFLEAKSAAACSRRECCLDEAGYRGKCQPYQFGCLAALFRTRRTVRT